MRRGVWGDQIAVPVHQFARGPAKVGAPAAAGPLARRLSALTLALCMRGIQAGACFDTRAGVEAPELLAARLERRGRSVPVTYMYHSAQTATLCASTV